MQTSEIFTIVYTNAIDSVILDLQTKAVKMNENLIKNGLQYFFAKKYSNAVASDYLSEGKLQKSEIGYDFVLQFKTYHFDKDLNLKNVTIW